MIFYFSGTGNTKWVASVLSSKTGERMIDVATVMRCKEKNENIYSDFVLNEGERVGFCFPVHGWRPPLIFRKFVQNLKLSNSKGHYCYVVCTAGDTVGLAIDFLKNDLKTIGITVDSEFSLIMPESYVGLPFMNVDVHEKEMSKKITAAKELENFSDIILNRKSGAKQVTVGRWPKTNSYLIGTLFTKCLITDRPFHVVENRCIGCGLCVKSCPVDNICLNEENKPLWKHNGKCLSCFACYHHCPNHAIEYGGRTKKKGQYYFK